MASQNYPTASTSWDRLRYEVLYRVKEIFPGSKNFKNWKHFEITFGICPSANFPKHIYSPVAHLGLGELWRD